MSKLLELHHECFILHDYKEHEPFRMLLAIKTIDYLKNPNNKIYHPFKYISNLIDLLDDQIYENFITDSLYSAKEFIKNSGFKNHYITVDEYLSSLSTKFPRYIDITYTQFVDTDFISKVFNIPFDSHLRRSFRFDIYSPIFAVIEETFKLYVNNIPKYQEKENTLRKLLFKKIKYFYTNLLKCDEETYTNSIYKNTCFDTLQYISEVSNIEFFNKMKTKYKPTHKNIVTFKITDLYNRVIIDNVIVRYFILDHLVRNKINDNINVQDIFMSNCGIFHFYVSKQKVNKNDNFMITSIDMKPFQKVIKDLIENLESLYFYNTLYAKSNEVIEKIEKQMNALFNFTSMTTLNIIYSIYNNDSIDKIIGQAPDITHQDFIDKVLEFIKVYKSEQYEKIYTNIIKRGYKLMMKFFTNNKEVLNYVPSDVYRTYKEEIVKYLVSKRKVDTYIPLFKKMIEIHPDLKYDEKLNKYLLYLI